MRYQPIPYILVLCLFAIAAPHSLASDDQSGSPRQQADIDFSGGTVPEFVEAVRNAFGDVNVVTDGLVEHFTVPAMRLHNVTISDAMQALQHVAEPHREAPDLQARLSTGLVSTRVWAVRTTTPPRSTPPQQRAPDPPSAVTRVHSLADVLQQFKPDEVFTSIEVALSLELGADPPEAPGVSPRHPRLQAALPSRPGPPELRLHEATGLLIARGTPAQMETVFDVILALRETAASKNQQEQFVRRQEHEIIVRDLQQTISRLRSELDELRNQRGLFDRNE